jgi:hypothetical protein
MLKLVAALLIFAIPQEHVIPAEAPLAVPRLNKGTVEGRTYKNASVGIELTPDSKLKFRTPELKGKPGTVQSSLMVVALGESKSGSARESTAFWAVPSAFYPVDQRSTDAFMRRVVEANQKDGLRPVRGSSEGVLGGVHFARTDFVVREGPARETVFVKACDTLGLGFVITGADQDTVDKLVAATELKFDLAISGCGSKAY